MARRRKHPDKTIAAISRYAQDRQVDRAEAGKDTPWTPPPTNQWIDLETWLEEMRDEGKRRIKLFRDGVHLATRYLPRVDDDSEEEESGGGLERLLERVLMGSGSKNLPPAGNEAKPRRFSIFDRKDKNK